MKRVRARWVATRTGIAARASRLWGWACKHGARLSVVPLIVSIVLTIVFWDWLTDGESGSTTVRNLGIVLAGLIALPLAVWRAKAADQQARATEQQAETALRQAETAQADLLNKRYQESAEMLGNAVLAVRLAGIYALQRLAKDHPDEYHIEVMKSLCGFVRNPFEGESPDPFLWTERGWEPKSLGAEDYDLRADVQAAMDATCTRRDRELLIEQEARFQMDLRYANLGGIKVLRAHLSGARLGGANLTKVIMIGWDLSDADLIGANLTRATLDGTDLSGANVLLANLTGADFTGGAFRSSASGLDPTFAAPLGRAATGLTQAQLDSAIADPENAPKLRGVLDAETGEQLIWRGKGLEASPYQPQSPQ